MCDVVAVLAAVVRGDTEQAAALAARGDSPLATALAAHLADAATGPVYDAPAAFEVFIRGGGNIPLYQAVSTALADLYDRLRPTSLLDIGTGDGRALLPALAASHHRITDVKAVEPSALGDKLDHVHPTTIQQFLATNSDTFDLVESTFALHAIPQAERDTVLADLAHRAGTLAIAEFDVPAHQHASPEHLEFLADTYERGLAEYTDDLVARGFLMPVLVGQLAPGAVRSTWEQPSSAWRMQVQRAGFTDVQITHLYDYWSSPAFLLIARGR